MKMSALSTGYRLVPRTGQQVLSQAGVEKYATGCGKLSMPSKHLDRQNTTQINLKKNEINLIK